MTKLRFPSGDESPHGLLTNATKSWEIIYPRNTIPFDAFNFEGFIRSADKKMVTDNVSLLCYAAIQGLHPIIRSLVRVSDMGDWRFRRELDKSLFFALCARRRSTAHLLLKYGAEPGRKHSSCGLHGAARRGFHDEIKQYIQEFDVSPNIKDEMSATPIMYAMTLEAPRDWETIAYLLRLGADADIIVDGWTYAQWARKMGKTYLALRLDGAAGESRSGLII